MSERYKHRLNSQSSEESVNVNQHQRISLESKAKLLPVGEINRVLDVAERFNEERQSCTRYRLNGTINPLMSNVLFNTTGPNSLGYFMTETLFRDKTYPSNGVNLNEEEDLTYREAINASLMEIDGWYGFTDPDIGKASLCTWFDMEPKRELFQFVPKNKINNWEMTVTYPALSADTFMTQGGLLVIEVIPVTVGNRNMVAFATPVRHNLTQGNTVRLSGLSSASLDGDYTVIRTGLDDGALKDYYFVVDIDTVNITTNTRMVRMFGTEPSVYYWRKLKKVATISSPEMVDGDYEMYNLNFSRDIYNDINSQFVINEDIDVAGLVDNLGRPLSELYVTFLKTDSNQGKGPIFTELKSGIEMPFIANTDSFPTTVPDIRRIHNGTSPTPHTPLETNVLITDNEFFCDVVEYNRFQVKETVLGEVRHQFNTTNRELGGTIIDPAGVESPVVMGNRYEGNFYKPHYKVEIREFSNYIEQGDSLTIGIPDYAEDLGDGRFIWRDLLDIGFSDTRDTPLDYPFLNGTHYIHQNYCVALRRQDPFAKYGLFYSTFPRDQIGDVMTDKFVVNSKENAC